MLALYLKIVAVSFVLTPWLQIYPPPLPVPWISSVLFHSKIMETPINSTQCRSHISFCPVMCPVFKAQFETHLKSALAPQVVVQIAEMDKTAGCW